jgi:NAD(P)-dependent dehydrogenase (short-subunit alcohol dehydrogenase family)
MTKNNAHMTDAWVLVSGGTGGIGAALAAKLAEAGIRPAIGYRSNRAAAESIANASGGEAFPLDLDDPSQIEATTSRLSGRNVTTLVMNASPAPDIEMFRKVSAESFEKQFQVSVIGNHLLLASMIGKVFRTRKAGTVIGMLTRAMGSDTKTALKYVTAHVVAKYGLLGLLKCAKAEYPWLRVETVSPDFTDTPMLDAFDSRFVEMLREQGKLSAPAAVADTILRKITG